MSLVMYKYGIILGITSTVIHLELFLTYLYLLVIIIRRSS